MSWLINILFACLLDRVINGINQIKQQINLMNFFVQSLCKSCKAIKVSHSGPLNNFNSVFGVVGLGKQTSVRLIKWHIVYWVQYAEVYWRRSGSSCSSCSSCSPLTYLMLFQVLQGWECHLSNVSALIYVCSLHLTDYCKQISKFITTKQEITMPMKELQTIGQHYGTECFVNKVCLLEPTSVEQLETQHQLFTLIVNLIIYSLTVMCSDTCWVQYWLSFYRVSILRLLKKIFQLLLKPTWSFIHNLNTSAYE